VQFFTERLKVALKDQGIRHDLIDAVLAADVRKDDIALVVKLVHALRDFVGTDNGANLLAAYKRGANILRIEEKKDGKSFDAAALNDALLKEQPEKDLAAALAPVAAKVKDLFAREDYTGCMAALSELRAPVDAFFDKIMVNAPEADIRANRLSLLSRLRDTMNTIADFSKTEG